MAERPTTTNTSATAPTTPTAAEKSTAPAESTAQDNKDRQQALNSIFNKKASEQLRSPDDLDKYVRVTNPSVWLALAACLLLTLGLLAWGVFGAVTSSVSTLGAVVDGKPVCFLSPDDVAKVHVGDDALFYGQMTKVAEVANAPLSRDEVDKLLDSDYLASSLMEEDWAYPVSFEPLGATDGAGAADGTGATDETSGTGATGDAGVTDGTNAADATDATSATGATDGTSGTSGTDSTGTADETSAGAASAAASTTTSTTTSDDDPTAIPERVPVQVSITVERVAPISLVLGM